MRRPVSGVRVLGSPRSEEFPVQGADRLEHEAQGTRSGNWPKNLPASAGIRMVITSAPHLRIVSEELFAAVERRFETTKKLWGVGNTGLSRGQQKKVYLFSRLLVCGERGGSITLVGGRAKTLRSE
jgi:hypothetical protein